MKAILCRTAVKPAMDLLRKKKAGMLTRAEVEKLLDHEDYQFEFRRYEGRVPRQAFVDYFLTFESMAPEQIQNNDLKNHHAFWLDLYENLSWFEAKAEAFFDQFNDQMVAEATEIAMAGFPQSYRFSDCKIIFTCGIGQSFGYANENGMHFDIMQLFRNYENEHFKHMVAHEIHHLIFLDNIAFCEENLEGYFLQWLAIEGLAIKFTNNAQGVWSQKLWPEEAAGLGLESIDYWNQRFDDTYLEFRNTIRRIRDGEIRTIDEIREHLVSYWFSLYADGQSKDEIPLLKQPRLYTMGNDLWGTFYDVYGMEALYETLNHPETFIGKFNRALRSLGRGTYCIG